MDTEDGVLFSEQDGRSQEGSSQVDRADIVPADFSSIRQSKTITFASYGLSRIHTHMLIHIREELQSFLVKHTSDVPEGTRVRVPLFVKDYPHFKGNVVALYNSLDELVKNSGNFIQFTWTYSERLSPLLRWMFGLDNVRGKREKLVDGAVVHRTSAIITDVDYVEGTSDYVMVNLNPSVVPFLLYDGSYIGSTMFSRDVALSFKSVYSIRIYEFLMDWSTKTTVKVWSLSELRFRLRLWKEKDGVRKELYVSNNYGLRSKILDVAKREINGSASSVSFDYELFYDPQFGESAAKTKREANAIRFYIRRRDDQTDRGELRQKMLAMLFGDISDKEKSVYCDRLAKQAVDNGQDEQLVSKFVYYGNLLKKGSIQRKEYVNTMLKIVREITGVDLRSDSHIRNSRLYSKKTGSSHGEPRLLFGDKSDE